MHGTVTRNLGGDKQIRMQKKIRSLPLVFNVRISI
jgi:hypothetical protein